LLLAGIFQRLAVRCGRGEGWGETIFKIFFGTIVTSLFWILDFGFWIGTADERGFTLI
jgi:hypothetical protein